jgi:hypothetical protein
MRFIRQASRTPELAARLTRVTTGIAWAMALVYAACLAILIIFS